MAPKRACVGAAVETTVGAKDWRVLLLNGNVDGLQHGRRGSMSAAGVGPRKALKRCTLV